MATFICIKCRKELDNKYMHKSNICVTCATSSKANNAIQNTHPKSLYRDKKHLCKLFSIYLSNEEQREKFVCYDTLTGIAYLVEARVSYEGQAIINSWNGQKITYSQVALFAKKYAANSDYINITDANWKSYLTISPDAQASNPASMNSITRTHTMAFLSNTLYNGTI